MPCCKSPVPGLQIRNALSLSLSFFIRVAKGASQIAANIFCTPQVVRHGGCLRESGTPQHATCRARNFSVALSVRGTYTHAHSHTICATARSSHAQLSCARTRANSRRRLLKPTDPVPPQHTTRLSRRFATPNGGAERVPQFPTHSRIAHSHARVRVTRVLCAVCCCCCCYLFASVSCTRHRHRRRCPPHLWYLARSPTLEKISPRLHNPPHHQH